MSGPFWAPSWHHHLLDTWIPHEILKLNDQLVFFYMMKQLPMCNISESLNSCVWGSKRHEACSTEAHSCGGQGLDSRWKCSLSYSVVNYWPKSMSKYKSELFPTARWMTCKAMFEVFCPTLFCVRSQTDWCFFTLRKALYHFTTFHHLGLSLTQSFTTLSLAAYEEPPVPVGCLGCLTNVFGLRGGGGRLGRGRHAEAAQRVAGPLPEGVASLAVDGAG